MFECIVSEKNHFFFLGGAKDKTGRHTVHLLCYQHGKLLATTTVGFGNLEKEIGKLSSLIPGFDYLNCHTGALLSDVLYEKLKKGEFPVYDAISALGWQPNHNRSCSYAGTQLLGPNGNVLFHGLAPDLPKSAGETKAWSHQLAKWAKGHIQRQAILALSLAAPLASRNGKNILVALTGGSSSGKTTAAQLAISLFMPPNSDKVSFTFNATDNALMQSLHENEGVPVLIDDTSLSGMASFENMIYTLANGTSRARLRNKRLEQTKHWHTTIFLTAERSLLDHRARNLEGALGRLIEMPISGADLFDSSTQAQSIAKFCHSCYGVAGVRFVRFLLQATTLDINERYRDWKEYLETQNLTQNHLVSRQIEQIALVSLAAELANQIGLTLNAEEIATYLLSCVLDSIECDAAAKDASLLAEQIVEEKIQEIFASKCNEIYWGQKGPFLSVSSDIWKEFVRDSELGAHEISRIRQQLGYTNATLSIGGKMHRGFYLNKEVNR